MQNTAWVIQHKYKATLLLGSLLVQWVTKDKTVSQSLGAKICSFHNDETVNFFFYSTLNLIHNRTFTKKHAHNKNVLGLEDLKTDTIPLT